MQPKSVFRSFWHDECPLGTPTYVRSRPSGQDGYKQLGVDPRKNATPQWKLHFRGQAVYCGLGVAAPWVRKPAGGRSGAMRKPDHVEMTMKEILEWMYPWKDR